MPTHNHDDNELNQGKPNVGGSPGYEVSDVSVQGVLVFLAALFVFLGVFFIFCFGMGKVINSALEKNDGPPNKWNAIAQTPEGKRENMASNPAMEQRQLRQMTERFPTPRLQSDDGNQDVADLHAREDLLLEHFSWVDRQQGKVRIPIERAMELVAQRGLAVAANSDTETEMTADSKPEVTTPLTSGFARTGYEQEVMQAREQQLQRGRKADQASLAK